MTEPVLALMGPTASGKSALAERLAERFDAELVSVDSALVYRGLSIGAAKPDYPHHLVHIREPDDPYTAADFASCLLYTSPSPRDVEESRMPSSA